MTIVAKFCFNIVLYTEETGCSRPLLVSFMLLRVPLPVSTDADCDKRYRRPALGIELTDIVIKRQGRTPIGAGYGNTRRMCEFTRILLLGNLSFTVATVTELFYKITLPVQFPRPAVRIMASTTKTTLFYSLAASVFHLRARQEKIVIAVFQILLFGVTLKTDAVVIVRQNKQRSILNSSMRHMAGSTDQRSALACFTAGLKHLR